MANVGVIQNPKALGHPAEGFPVLHRDFDSTNDKRIPYAANRY